MKWTRRCVETSLIWLPNGPSSAVVSWVQLSDMFRPCGERVCKFNIQKSSLYSNRLRIFSFDNDLLSTSSMIVNLAWTLKLWAGIWKCLSHGEQSVLQTSFLCVFILKFKLYLDFSIYCDFSQRQHSIR